MSSTALCRCRIAVRHIDDLEATDVETVLARDGVDLGRRSDQDWSDESGVAPLPLAPRSDVSSQGCTTTVVAAGTCLALAISRSYFA